MARRARRTPARRGLRLLRAARELSRARRTSPSSSSTGSTPTVSRSANALVAWLDGPIVDDGTACEIGMFAELVRSGGSQYRGIVAISTDIRLRAPPRGNVVGGGMNLFVVGAIE